MQGDHEEEDHPQDRGNREDARPGILEAHLAHARQRPIGQAVAFAPRVVDAVHQGHRAHENLARGETADHGHAAAPVQAHGPRHGLQEMPELRRVRMGHRHVFHRARLALRNYSDATCLNYFHVLRSFLERHPGDPRLRSPEDISRYLLDLQSRVGLSASTRNLHRDTLSFFYQHVLKLPDRARHLPQAKEAQKLPDILTPQEILLLLDAAPNPKHRLMLAIAYGCGLRVSELAHLKTEDVDWTRKIVRVVEGKGKKDRIVALPQTLTTELDSYLRTYRPLTYKSASGSIRNGMRCVQQRTRPSHPVDCDGASTKRPLFRSRRDAFVGEDLMGGHPVSLNLPKPRDSRRSGRLMVGPGRLELPTPALSERCSNQLSYGPKGRGKVA